MSKGCEMCNRTGVVFKPGMPGLDDKDTCPECGGRGIVESATVPAGNRDAAADLDVVKKKCDFCHGEGAFETAIHGVHDVCLECHGTGRDEPTECLEIAEYWIERAEHLEAENEELRSKLVTLEAIRRGVR